MMTRLQMHIQRMKALKIWSMQEQPATYLSSINNVAPETSRPNRSLDTREILDSYPDAQHRNISYSPIRNEQ